MDVVVGVAAVVASSYAVLQHERRRVELTPPEEFISQEAAGLPVLVTKQRVDKRVAGRLAVRQTFGQHPPVRTYGPWEEEFYKSTSNKAEKKEDRSHTQRDKYCQFLDQSNWGGRHLLQMSTPTAAI